MWLLTYNTGQVPAPAPADFHTLLASFLDVADIRLPLLVPRGKVLDLRTLFAQVRAQGVADTLTQDLTHKVVAGPPAL